MMEIDILALFAVLLIAFSAILLFLTSDWRLSILLLAVQYIGVFLLVSLEWPIFMAVVKLVAGWMAGAVLGMAVTGVPKIQSDSTTGKDADVEAEAAKEANIAAPSSHPPEERPVTGRAFYLLATLLVGLVVVSQADRTLGWIPGIEIEQVWGGLLLIGMGLLKLGFTAQPLPATIGLLTTLSGFEILYASIEKSTLVAGVLAGITLGLALAGAYLMMAPYLEETA